MTAIAEAFPAIGEWMNYFRPHPGASILDLGAHCGENVSHFARLGHPADGVEINPELCDLFDDVPGARMWNMDIEDFVPQQTYDYVLLTEVLEHVKDPAAVIDAARRCMGPESVLYVTVPAILWGSPIHRRGIQQEELAELLHQSGLHAFALFCTMLYSNRLPETIAFARTVTT